MPAGIYFRPTNLVSLSQDLRQTNSYRLPATPQRTVRSGEDSERLSLKVLQDRPFGQGFQRCSWSVHSGDSPKDPKEGKVYLKYKALCSVVVRFRVQKALVTLGETKSLPDRPVIQ